jgi:hypothetical protein
VTIHPAHTYPRPGVSPPPSKKRLAIASLVLGIVALIGSVAPLFNVLSIVMGATAIVLAARALASARRRDAGGWSGPGWDADGRYTGNRDTDGKGMAAAGLALSIVAIIGSILMDLAFFSTLEDSRSTCRSSSTTCAWTAPR